MVGHGIWYSISIRKDADSDKSLLRKYLWVAQKDKVDPDTSVPIKDEQGKILKVDFCFEHSERDFLNKIMWQTKHDAAKEGTGGIDTTCPE